MDDTGLYLFSPYPRSEIFDDLRKEGRIEDLDERYFAGLMSIMGVGHSTHFCDAVGPREMNIYGLAGMGGFYFFSYLSCSWRILRSIKIIGTIDLILFLKSVCLRCSAVGNLKSNQSRLFETIPNRSKPPL